MADNNLNTQLQNLHARLDRVDDDLVAHYAGISRLVIALAANPNTAASAAPSLISYNMSSAGQTLVRKMLHLIPGYDTFKKLQHLDAAALLNGVESNITSQIANLGATLTDAITSATNSLTDRLTEQATATLEKVAAVTAKTVADDALQFAITNNLGATEIAARTQAVSDAAAVVTTKTGLETVAITAAGFALDDKNHIMKALGTIDGFVSTIKDIAQGKTITATFKK